MTDAALAKVCRLCASIDYLCISGDCTTETLKAFDVQRLQKSVEAVSLNAAAPREGLLQQGEELRLGHTLPATIRGG